MEDYRWPSSKPSSTSIKIEQITPKFEPYSIPPILKNEYINPIELTIKTENDIEASSSTNDPDGSEMNTSSDDEQECQDDPLATETDKAKICPLCHRSFERPSAVTRHMLIHTGELPFACTTPNCGKRFNRKANLRRHIKASHAKDSAPKFKCSYAACGQTFSVKQNMLRHEKTTHRRELAFECECCGERFRDSADLRDHQRSHTGERPFECQECHNKFYSKSGLVQHMKLHKRPKKFKCEECDERFGRQLDLEFHVNVHKGVQPLKCELCPKFFPSRMKLNRHLKIHRPSQKNGV